MKRPALHKEKKEEEKKIRMVYMRVRERAE
jgi:hypothetical protein